MKYEHTKQGRLKQLRAEAKKHGLTFKAVNVTYNGSQAYALFSRSTGLQVSNDNILTNWYDGLWHESIIENYKGNQYEH